MKLKSCYLCFVASLLCFGSCNHDNDEPYVVSSKTNHIDEIVFATTITNPEGNSGSSYLQTVPQFEKGSYDNSRSVQVGFGATPIAFSNGHIYGFPDYMGSSKADLRLFTRTPQHTLEEQGALQLPAGAGACCVVELNKEKAYVSCQSLNFILVFNPKTMQELGRIDLSSCGHEHTHAAPSAMLIDKGKLYVVLNQFNSQWMPEDHQAEVAVIDTHTDRLLHIISNTSHHMSVVTRPMDPHSIFMDEKGDIYLCCVGAFGFNPDFPAGIIRIKKGSEEIDKNYCLSLDKLPIEGLEHQHISFLNATYYAGNGKLYASAYISTLDKQVKEHPYTAFCSAAVEIDLYQQSIRLLKGIPFSNPQGIGIGKHKDWIVFGSANQHENGFYAYQPATGKFSGPILRVQGWPSFFYSFAQ